MPTPTTNIHATGTTVQRHIFHQVMDSPPISIETLHTKDHMDQLNSLTKPTSSMVCALQTPASLTRTISRKLPNVLELPSIITSLLNSCGPLIMRSKPSGITLVPGISDGPTPLLFHQITNCNTIMQPDKPNT